MLRALCTAPCAWLSRASYQLVPTAASPSPPTAASSARSRVPSLSLADSGGGGSVSAVGGGTGDDDGNDGNDGGRGDDGGDSDNGRGSDDGRQVALELAIARTSGNARTRFDREALAQAAQDEAENQAEEGAEFVVPGSELQRAIAMSLGASAHVADGHNSGTETDGNDPLCVNSRSLSSSPSPRECIICMEEFDSNNPEINTLCKCGINRAHWHLMCLMQWLEKDSTCPVCREPIFYEESE